MNNRAKKATAWATGAVAGVSSSLAFPALAFAAEERTGLAVILPDMNEFIPMLIAFIVIAIVLVKFGWPMFEAMLDKREKTIAEALQKSEEARIESERVLAEYQSQLSEAKAQSAQIIAEARETGEALRADISKQAQEEAAGIIEKARVAIEAEKQAAMTELRNSVADLSVVYGKPAYVFQAGKRVRDNTGPDVQP